MGEGEEDGEGAVGASGSRKLTPAQMEALLAKRIELMKAGGMDGKDSDKYRVFKFIIDGLQSDRKLRLMVQASAGTGKSEGLSVKITHAFEWLAKHRALLRLSVDDGVPLVSGSQEEGSRCSPHRCARCE